VELRNRTRLLWVVLASWKKTSNPCEFPWKGIDSMNRGLVNESIEIQGTGHVSFILPTRPSAVNASSLQHQDGSRVAVRKTVMWKFGKKL
jgi:hypothetical protein